MSSCNGNCSSCGSSSCGDRKAESLLAELNPNSTVKERADAIKLINKCYVMLTAVNETIIIAILIPILLLISILTRGNNNNNVANTNPTPKK